MISEMIMIIVLFDLFIGGNTQMEIANFKSQGAVAKQFSQSCKMHFKYAVLERFGDFWLLCSPSILFNYATERDGLKGIKSS